jgi:aryl-alcohol dehydrogenase-like predicted oxidoreductase
MQKRRLGKTDIEVSPVGLGTWQFSRGGGPIGGVWGDLSQETADRIVAAALKGGIDWFDTAEVYGMGLSERTLAKALADNGKKSGDIKIATKWFPLLRTARSIGATIGKRMDALAPYPIDLHQIHMPLSLSSIPAQMLAMAALVKAGKIKAVGVSNFSSQAMRLAHAVLASEGIPLASNQVRVSLVHRSIENNGVLAAARELGVSLIAYSPLAQGLLTGVFHENPERIKKISWMRKAYGNLSPKGLARTAPLIAELKGIAAAHDAQASQVALRWLLDYYGDRMLVIPGATKPAQSESAAGAMDLSLSEKEIARLEELSRPRR